MTPKEAVKIKAIVNYRDDRILEELAEEFPEYANIFLPEPAVSHVVVPAGWEESVGAAMRYQFAVAEAAEKFTWPTGARLGETIHKTKDG